MPRWWSQLESYGEMEGYPGAAIPGAESVAKWLEEHRPSEWSPGILHGDFHMANVLFSRTSGELAAVVDWELCTIGDPLLDLGEILATWPDPDGSGSGLAIQPWEGFAEEADLVRAYEEASGRELGDLSLIHI